MKPFYFLFGSLFFCLLGIASFAQEKKDSLHLKVPRPDSTFLYKKQTPTIKTDSASLLPSGNKQIVNGQLLPQSNWNHYSLSDEVERMADGRLYSLYSSPNDALHYFAVWDPIFFGVDFHLKPYTKWEKLDVYFFVQGILINRYSIDELYPAANTTKYFHLGGGMGAEYRFDDDKSIFIEKAALFRNSSFMGSRNKAGVRFRF